MTDIYASIDLGGTKIACVFATDDGKILAEKTVPTHSHEGPPAVLARIAELVNETATTVGQRPSAAGLGVPGLADLAAGSDPLPAQPAHPMARRACARRLDPADRLPGLPAERRAHGHAWRAAYGLGHPDHGRQLSRWPSSPWAPASAAGW